MRPSARSGIGATALAAAALAALSLAFAPAAAAVTPATATASYDCGFWGGGAASLTATQEGTAATITLTSAVTTPVAVGADEIDATLTLARNGGGTAQFTGEKNPALPAGSPVVIGPLSGTVASGDSLDSYFGGTALSMTIFGIRVGCDAVSSQSPGPFVFD
ncbi:hypothetical protein QCN29_21355 [Streptomyces sp. HNM0663]|uniref:Uncharacterized protein n=1 Tax=Streptomyces chengmaiensis TaxID=3040919 RepID=A0ABT6HT99_9ACTN|nr:hypothetical protein [Streptomyces chengmaiensis]MDH2391284.1 hypothetical protein [Streptomyces chengmaiensis]